jgi:hypothetical protein
MNKIDTLKKKIEIAQTKRKELLMELDTFQAIAREERRKEDLRKVEELKKKLLNSN